MARDWVLVASLQKLRDEFNNLAPNRDKASDGSIGDAAHRQTNSDHNPDEESDALRDHDADSKNEVHAIDVDRDLRTPGVTMENVVQLLLNRCRSGAETRLKYIIFNRRIWSASSDWIQRTYTGSNPHDHHAHFSGKYDSASESSVRSWHLEDLEDDMPLNADDKKWISGEIAKQLGQVINAIPDAAPTAQQNADATLRTFRSSPTTGMSDTGANLIVSQLSAAVKAGKSIKPYPSNEGKSLGELE